MFLVTYFKESFQFETILTQIHKPWGKLLVYLLFLLLVSVLPMNFLITKESGFRIDFVSEDFKTLPTNWVLPSDSYIAFGEYHSTDLNPVILTHQDITYIFNGTKEDVDTTIKSFVFTEKVLFYTDGAGHYMEGSYRGFTTSFNFNDVNLMDETEKAITYQTFGQSIEASFSRYIIFYTLLVNTGVYLLMQVSFVLMLALVLQLFRLGYQSFLSYLEGVQFIIMSLGLPTIIGLIVGIISPAFGSVFYQLTVGLTVMIVMIKYGRSCIK